ncbi:MAG: AlpA family phage regulatory protein [Pseudomonadota bacterium]
MSNTQSKPATGITLSAVLNFHEVQRLSSLARASIYRGVAAGTFPAPIPLTPGGRRVGWREGDLRDWLSNPLGWRANSDAPKTTT